jgi:hypothetical protein
MANSMLEAVQGMLWTKGLHLGKLSGNARLVAGMMGKADTIPFPGSQMHDHCMTVARVPARKFYWDGSLCFDVQAAVQRWYGMDSATVVADVYNFEVEALGARMIYSDIAMPTVDTDHPLISGPQDLAKMKPLDPSKGRVSMVVELTANIVQKGGGLLSGGMFCSPFSLMCQAMGYPRSVRALRREPDFAKDLFAYIENDVILPFAKAQRDGAGAKQVTGADAWSAIPNLTPQMVEEWVIPSVNRLKAKGKAELGMKVFGGAAAADYCEEDPSKFDRQLMWRCFDLANQLNFLGGGKMAFMGMGRTQDWDPHWVQDYAMQDGLVKKALIYASLNGRFLRDSSPQDIVGKLRQWIDVMGREGKIAIAVANIPADTPPVNVFSAVAATHVLGRQPMPTDLGKVVFEVPKFQAFDEWLKGQPEEERIRKAREK